MLTECGSVHAFSILFGLLSPLLLFLGQVSNLASVQADCLPAGFVGQEYQQAQQQHGDQPIWK